MTESEDAINNWLESKGFDYSEEIDNYKAELGDEIDRIEDLDRIDRFDIDEEFVSDKAKGFVPIDGRTKNVRNIIDKINKKYDYSEIEEERIEQRESIFSEEASKIKSPKKLRRFERESAKTDDERKIVEQLVGEMIEERLPIFKDLSGRIIRADLDELSSLEGEVDENEEILVTAQINALREAIEVRREEL